MNKLTGSPSKWVCCICYTLNKDSSLKEANMLLGTKFRNNYTFCDKHIKEIVDNGKLEHYYNILNIK